MGISLIADVAEEVGNSTQLEKDLGEAVSLATPQPQGKPKTQQPSVAQDDDADEDPKYRGKTRQEIKEMHRNAESRLGSMANDLGTQRKLTDRLLDLKREDDLARNTPAVKVSREELLSSDDPTQVLDRFVGSRLAQTESEVKTRLERMEQSLAQTSFVARHPDYIQLANDQDFITWAGATPYRTRLAALAVQQNDWAAADELMTEFKANRPAGSQQKRKPADSENLSAARSAALESGAATGADRQATKSGKVYRRADLIRLRMDKPDEYYRDDFQAEITRAYAEGRVK